MWVQLYPVIHISFLNKLLISSFFVWNASFHTCRISLLSCIIRRAAVIYLWLLIDWNMDSIVWKDKKCANVWIFLFLDLAMPAVMDFCKMCLFSRSFWFYLWTAQSEEFWFFLLKSLQRVSNRYELTLSCMYVCRYTSTQIQTYLLKSLDDYIAGKLLRMKEKIKYLK